MSVQGRHANWEITAKFENGRLAGLEDACDQLNRLIDRNEDTCWTPHDRFFHSGGHLFSYMTTFHASDRKDVIDELTEYSKYLPLVFRVEYYDEDGDFIRFHIAHGECETMEGKVVYPEPKNIFW